MLKINQDIIDALKNPHKETYIKLEFYNSNMDYISEITKPVLRNEFSKLVCDEDRTVRKNFSYALPNTDLNYIWGEDNLVWLDKRCILYLGIKLNNGEIGWIKQGVFVLTEPQTIHTLDGIKTTLNAQDKSYLLTDKRGKFTNQLTIERGTVVTDAIKIIAIGGGETLFNFENDIDVYMPYEQVFDSTMNRWDAIKDLADIAKCDVFYDADGYLTLKKKNVDFEEDSHVWKYTIGDGFYTGNVRSLDESELANHIIVLGGSSQTAECKYELKVSEYLNLNDYLNTCTGEGIKIKQGVITLKENYLLYDDFKSETGLDATKWSVYTLNSNSSAAANGELLLQNTGKDYGNTGVGVFSKIKFSKSGVYDIRFDWFPSAYSQYSFPTVISLCNENANRNSDFGYRNTKMINFVLGDYADTEKRTILTLATESNNNLLKSPLNIYNGTYNRVKILFDCNTRNIKMYINNFNKEILSHQLSQSDFDSLGNEFILEFYKPNKNIETMEMFDLVKVLNLNTPYVANGSVESAPIDLSSVGFASNTSVSWNQILNNGTVKIEYAISENKGLNWGSWIIFNQGSKISQIPIGINLNNYKIKFKITLTTNNQLTTPEINNFNIKIFSGLWQDSPYTIQKIGDIIYKHNDGQPDPLISTEDECKWRAKYELMKRLGYNELVELTIAPNYIHEIGDVIEVEDKYSGTTGRYKIKSMDIPLQPDYMTIQCYKQRNVIKDWDFILSNKNKYMYFNNNSAVINNNQQYLTKE